jgi:uncharacterized protein YdhG (YjbR/CyaY superfamily)
MKSAENIDQYISTFPDDIRKKLDQIRNTIRKAAPQAEEAIKYAMPTYVSDGNLVHFAACKSHIGFYPAPSSIVNFKKELSEYVCTKGAIQFPYSSPLPLKLITAIVKFRLEENKEKARKPTHDFMSNLSAPARRALESEGISTLMQLSKWTEKDLLTLHGMGKTALPTLRLALKSKGLSFSKK